MNEIVSTRERIYRIKLLLDSLYLKKNPSPSETRMIYDLEMELTELEEEINEQVP